MSAEVASKKRGRPKKAAENSVDSANGGDELSVVTTSKRSTKSRTLSTTESKSATLKKVSRRKHVDTIEDAPPDELEAQKTSKPGRSVAKPKASKSTILDEAAAFRRSREEAQSSAVNQIEEFRNQRQIVADNSTQSAPAEQVLEALQLKSTLARTTTKALDTKEVTKPKSQTSASTKTRESGVEPRKPASESSEKLTEALQLDPKPAATKSPQAPPQHLAPTEPVPTNKAPSPQASQSQAPRSSFLSTFLDDKIREPAPVASEDDIISDRTAFKSSKFAPEDIVAGAGVSDLSSMLTASSRKATSILKQPKAFKAHTLNAFAHGPHESLHPRQRSRVKQVEPETFAAGSFKAFKAAEPTISPSAPTTEPEKPFFTQAKSSVLPAQGSVADQPANAPRPVPQSQSEPIQQQTQPQPQPQPAKPISHLRSAAPVSLRPHPTDQQLPTDPFAPKRPTQMSYAELKRNQSFKTLRRRWTGLIVGVPVLVVTSYVLWERLNVSEELEGMRGKRVGVGRERGVVPEPAPMRVLDDGALGGDGKNKDG